VDKENFANVTNHIDDLTLGQIIRLISKLKYRTVTMILFFIISVLGGTFAAGQYTQQKDTAVMLESPFSMRIDIEGQAYDFNNLTLVRDPSTPSVTEDTVVLSLREIKTAFDIIPVGKVIARVEQDKISGIWKLIISQDIVLVNEVQAQEIPVFNWYGHENDYKFKEKFVADNTVYRYYSDGCILAYEVDSNRRSIPGSFRWIENVH
jgi:hypothetical protein